MEKIKGTSNTYLEINLTNQTWSVFSPDARLLKEYIGGKGLGLKLYYDRLKDSLASVDPLGEENILCFMMGLFAATKAPCSARFDCVTKSPLTGIMASSSCGGPFGYACKTAGYDGVIVTGKAQSLISVHISKDGVEFRNAENLKNDTTGETQKKLCVNLDQGACVIGPAGEHGVLYANIASGDRFLGRGGMGAVMGSKNLKALVAHGRSFEIEPFDPERFKKINAKAQKHIIRNSFTKAYSLYGTNYNVNFSVDAGFAPVRNFKNRTDERCRQLSGETMAKRYDTEHDACLPCSVLCGHKGTYPDGKKRHLPEYETIGLWGGNIENYDPDLVGEWNDLLNEYGMDTISSGVTVGWAMEAAEKKLRASVLEFGKTDNIADIIHDIAFTEGEGKDLALGTKRLSEKYGGKDFAIHVKGLELAAYDPRGAWGQALNFAVANRGGCHLSGFPVSLEVLLDMLPQYTTISKAVWLVFLEDLFCAVNSLHTCQFTIFSYLLEPPIAKYTPKPLLKMAMLFLPHIAISVLDWSLLSGFVTAISGIPMTSKEFLRSGKRTHLLERYMNVQMGISAKDDTLPSRFLDEADTNHPVKKAVPLEVLLRKYYRERKYDKNGVPDKRQMKKLGVI